MSKFKLILLIIWMSLIFCLSNQHADESSKLSNGLIDKTIINVYKVFNSNITNTDKEMILRKYSKPVRKLAHFTVYFILGILVYIYLKEYTVTHVILYSLLLCFLYACSDEFHQYFVMGRYCSIIDVLIDSFGSLIRISGLNGILK